MELLKLLVCMGLLASCGTPAKAPSGEICALPTDPNLSDCSLSVVHCRIVDGAENGNLLLANLKNQDVYRLSVENIPVVLDGKPSDASKLSDGMPVDISFSGDVMETFPAQLGTVTEIEGWSIGQGKNPGGTCYDLCGLYLQVLDDLWKVDVGLNSDIKIAGLDLSQAPGDLTESEKSAIAWRFGEMHNVEVVMGTFEELEAQGYFTSNAIGQDSSYMWTEWKDGCLFSITSNTEHEEEIYSLPTLFFNAEKWRSPLGAYCFYDSSVTWPEFGTWTNYKVGAEMIS